MNIDKFLVTAFYVAMITWAITITAVCTLIVPLLINLYLINLNTVFFLALWAACFAIAINHIMGDSIRRIIRKFKK